MATPTNPAGMPPIEPSSANRISARVLRDWREALLEAGFTREEALGLVNTFYSVALSAQVFGRPPT